MEMTMELSEHVRQMIRDVVDFPKPGIVYKDITPVLSCPETLGRISDWIAQTAPADIDTIVGIESRGFLFAAALSERLDAGFVPARKAGKLPWHTVSTSYALEYGDATLEMHRDAITPGSRVLVVDDLLATGGTVRAASALVKELGGHVVGTSVLVELCFLNGRATLDSPVKSLVTY
jgi:adenine phosphoribosyltransferase